MTGMEEKVTFQNSKGTKLVGVLHLPNEKANSAVIISHGFAANKDRNRLIKLAELLSKKGFVALRFDFGGCGGSEEREINLKGQLDDLKSAIDYMRKRGYSKLGLLGESLGGLISILACSGAKTLVLWAPLTKPTDIPIIQKELRDELSRKDVLNYKKDGREFKIPKEFLDELLAIDQQKVLSRVQSPVLVIHGTLDETIPLEHSKEAMQFLPEESVLKIIEGANHTFDGKLSEAISESISWFEKYLR